MLLSRFETSIAERCLLAVWLHEVEVNGVGGKGYTA